MELYEDSEEWSTLSQDQQKEKEEELQTVVSDAKQTNEMASRSVYMVTMVASTTSRYVSTYVCPIVLIQQFYGVIV